MFGDLPSLRGDVDPIVSGLAVELSNNMDQFQAHLLAPTVPVKASEGTFFVFNADAFLGNDTITYQRAAGAPATQVRMDATTGTYVAIEYSCEFVLPARDVKEGNSVGLDLQRAAASVLAHRLMIDKERVAATVFITTGNWTSTAASTAGFDHASAATPMANIATGVQAVLNNSGRLPNACGINFQTAMALQRHADFTSAAALPGATAPARVTMPLLKEILKSQFGFEHVIISSAARNSADEGLTVVGAACWSTDNMWIGVVDSPSTVSPMSVCAAKTFEQQPLTATYYWDPKIKAHVYELSTIYDIQPIAAQYGYTITNTIV